MMPSNSVVWNILSNLLSRTKREMYFLTEFMSSYDEGLVFITFEPFKGLHNSFVEHRGDLRTVCENLDLQLLHTYGVLYAHIVVSLYQPKGTATN
jgi:hypothetical protein